MQTLHDALEQVGKACFECRYLDALPSDEPGLWNWTSSYKVDEFTMEPYPTREDFLAALVQSGMETNTRTLIVLTHDGGAYYEVRSTLTGQPLYAFIRVPFPNSFTKDS